MATAAPMKELNILILGETGVGKSTWINGVQNYLYFDNLNDAMYDPGYHVLIPSSFTFTKKGEQRVIEIGEHDSNEVRETGKSATKAPRSYVFEVGDEKIRLIDTPGIGDSEGIEQDQKNLDNILTYLTSFKEIHAVCILLQPNNSRLTAMFRFCIQELLVQLHSSAKHNIVFCFTNARATFYEPGDTLPALNKMLKEKGVGIQATPENYFCFDNEPFRFLACIKEGVEFSQTEIDTYAKSWEKSVEETNRLFEHIRTKLKPHQVRDTLSMNEARRIILAMSKPLAKVAEMVEFNVHAAEDAKRQIQLADSDIKTMQKDLMFPGYDLERVELSYPMTVCTDDKCVKYVPVGIGRVQNTVYEQVCHKHCYLEGIPIETTNNPKLQSCWCIQSSGDGQNCGRCQHHHTRHMHLTWDTKVVPKQFLSTQVQSDIQQKGSLKSQKEAFIEEIDTKIVELQKEEKYIMKSAAKFGSFLKANALIPYNDAVGDYLDMCIDQEKKKPKAIKNDKHLLKMKEMKREYERQRHILDNAINTGASENISSPADVMKLQKELFQLKHFGQTLKKLFEGISITYSARNKEFSEKVAPIPRKHKERGKSASSKVPAKSSGRWLWGFF